LIRIVFVYNYWSIQVQGSGIEKQTIFVFCFLSPFFFSFHIHNKMRANSFVVALILAMVMVMTTAVQAMPLSCDDSMTHDYALQSQLDLMSGAAVSKDELDIKARDNTTTMASNVALTCLQRKIDCRRRRSSATGLRLAANGGGLFFI
jgi:hypothetical protein